MTPPATNTGSAARGAWDRLWAPGWAGGWAAMRWLWLWAALLTHAPRLMGIPDAYAAQDMVFGRLFWRVSDHVILNLPAGYALWALGMVGLGLVAWGGRATRPGILIFVVGAYLLAGHEALNTKAYDRLLLWQAAILLLSPVGERELHHKARGPTARWLLLVLYLGLYGSTGWLKALDEPTWWDGGALAYELIDPNFGGTRLGAWLSGRLWRAMPLGILTVIFEASFPLLILLRRAQPWVLLLGLCFHAGIAMLMNVGTFSWVAIAAYPVLLHPETAHRSYLFLRRRLGRERECAG